MKNAMVLKFFDLEKAHGRRGAVALLICGVLVLASLVVFSMMCLAGFQVLNLDLSFWQGAFAVTGLLSMFSYTIYELESYNNRLRSQDESSAP